MDPRAFPEPSEVTTNPGGCRDATLGEQHKSPSHPHSQKTQCSPAFPNLSNHPTQIPHTQDTCGQRGQRQWELGVHSVLQQVPQVICLKEVCDTLSLKPPEIVILFQGG